MAQAQARKCLDSAHCTWRGFLTALQSNCWTNLQECETLSDPALGATSSSPLPTTELRVFLLLVEKTARKRTGERGFDVLLRAQQGVYL